ncbi:hypothetical protein, partial [Streptomyces mirabilis]|uniref:hypothetical protein n=1 Tax=Streptomyces mirabilis TaxID=68239 RepID=UPI00340D3241
MSGAPPCDRPLHRQGAGPLPLATVMCRPVMSPFRRHQECDRLGDLLRRTEPTARLADGFDNNTLVRVSGVVP